MRPCSDDPRLEVFERVRGMVFRQPLSVRVSPGRALERRGVDASYMDELNEPVRLYSASRSINFPRYDSPEKSLLDRGER
jgi:hypothetical protein